MARRENQGPLITLIVFVMLTIMLAVFSIVFWNKAKGLEEQAKALQDRKNEADTAASRALEETLQLKSWLGFAADAKIEDIKDQKDRDMNTYARSLPEVQRNYKDVPARLFDALQQRNVAVADLRQQLNQARDEYDQNRQTLQQSLDEAKKAQAAADAELRKTRDEFATARDALNTEKDNLVSQLQKSRTEYEELERSTAKQVETLTGENRDQKAIIDQRDNQIRQVTNESFDVPDGKVLWVNARTGTVYINLGSADGLRKQVNFSVYPVDVNNLARQEKKGSIEVTRVVSDHMSEARITSDKVSDPILAGDVIFTPLWNARSALHFALAGFMDVDGDGKNDRDLVKRLIQLNSGTVDAEDRNGEIVGEVTPHTRYLIRGDEPAIASSSEANDAGKQAKQDAWTKIIKQADRFGVEQISVEKLLEFVGYDGEKRTIPLGDAADPDDFQERSDSSRGQGSVFRERRP